MYRCEEKKVRRANEAISRNKILMSCICGNSDVFEELKRIRKTDDAKVPTMDGVKHDDIPAHFAKTFNELYTKHEDGAELRELQRTLDSDISEKHLGDVHAVDAKVVKEAIEKLKHSKSDPAFCYSSDCFKQGPDILSELLAGIFRLFLVHALSPSAHSS